VGNNNSRKCPCASELSPTDHSQDRRATSGDVDPQGGQRPRPLSHRDGQSHSVRFGEEVLRRLQALAYMSHPTAPRMKSLAVINADQRTTLRAALTSPCGWLGLLAPMVSQAATDDELSAMLIADVATMRPPAQRWAVFAACHLATDPIGVAERLVDADVGTRAATAGYLKQLGGTPEGAAALNRRFLNDDDLRVQLAAGYQGPVDAVAKVWTCWSCSQENDIAAEDCAHCAHGSRP